MSIRRSAFAAVLAVLLFLQPSLALAQQQPQAAPVVEVLEVGLTNVDFVATDKGGQPVAGLKASDFEVFEDGKRVEVTHFAEVGSSGSSAVLLPDGTPAKEAPTAPQIARKFIFYMDDATLSLDNRKTVFPALRKFVAEQLRPGDQAMLVTWNRELKVRVPWTDDRAVFERGIDTIQAEVTGASYLHSEKDRVMRHMSKMHEEAAEPKNNLAPLWSELENATRSYAEMYKNDATHGMNALAKLLASLTGVDGKKVLVIATETLPTLAGAEVFEHFEAIRTAVISSNHPWKNDALQGSRITDRSRYNVQPMLDVIARAANATGVTVYGLNPRGLGGPAAGKTDQQMFRDSASIEFSRSEQSIAGISLLANRTGGLAMVGAPADLALERVGRDLGAYYSLGYRSTPGISPERKIEVRSKRPDVKVRARTNVYYRSLEREMADRVIANHLQSKPVNQLGVALEADPATSDGSRRLVPVRVIIPVNTLTLIPDGKGNVTGGFSVFTCTGDGAGDASGVNVQSQAITFTAEQAAQMKGRRIGFAIQVPIEKARHQISVGVLDHVSHEQGFATLKAAL